MEIEDKLKALSNCKKGEEVADLTWGTDGKTYHLSDYKGKKVYLNFWASWCSICLAIFLIQMNLVKKLTALCCF